MSILSDASIRALCELPQKIYDSSIRLQLDAQVDWKSLSGSVRDEIDRKHVEAAYREPNAEERAAYKPMIEPFVPTLVRKVEYGIPLETSGGCSATAVDQRKVVSYGLSSYGYDIRLTDDVKIFTNVNATEIDPLNFDSQGCLVQAEVRTTEDGARYVLIPPHSYMLGSTVEYFRIPRDVMVICLGKSTYARCGAIVNTTPIEPEFEGNVVIEISNSTPLPMRIYLDQGIGQFLFFRGDQPCETSYNDRGGKYQGQTGVTLPRA